MIKCNRCQSEINYSGKTCPICKAEMGLSPTDIEAARRELVTATAQKNSAKVTELRHLLADAGDAESAREYAKHLESSSAASGNIDAAMEYYRLALNKHDPYSAYRYSKLIGRHSERASAFYLKFAAVLGAIDSYPDCSELCSAEGNEPLAAYFCYLAAGCDDTVSVVNMAKRWCEGVGVEANPAYAKWYIDKMTIPPISALKLAYKLRSVRAEQPPILEFPQYEKFVRSLSDEALALGYDSAYFKLTSMLAELGNINGIAALGILYAEGKGIGQDTERAKHYIDLSISKGNAAAAIYIAGEYAEGRCFEQNTELALEYYRKAASLGYTAAYERIGDVYNDGVLVERDIKQAQALYDLAATESAEQKSVAIKSKRYEFYKSGCEIALLKDAPTEDMKFTAFRSFAIATAMGEPNSALKLAECYATGFGTERDMKSAFYWYKAAYNDGNADALLPLALCYSRGRGVAFSYSLAVRYLKLASERGMHGADEELEVLYQRRMRKMIRSIYSCAMSLIHLKKYTEAMELLERSAGLGYPKALYTLGCLYEFGVGTGRSDRAAADKYYAQALQGNKVFEKFKDPSSAYKLKILKMIR